MIRPVTCNTTTGAPLRPCLKWVGGKRWLTAIIAALHEEHEQLFFQELFAGGLAVSFGLRPKYVFAGDIHAPLINFYTQVQRGELPARPDLGNDKDDYLRARSEFNQMIANGEGGTPEAAYLLFYLNKTCFNGLSRFNQQGEFNVPFGDYKSVDYSMNFEEHREAMRYWYFEREDFREATLQPGAVVYADPPYIDSFTTYAGAKFGWGEHVDLAFTLAEHDGPVVVSNSADERIVGLYESRGFDIQVIEAPRSIAADGGSRKKAKEIVATKNIDLPDEHRVRLLPASHSSKRRRMMLE